MPQTLASAGRPRSAVVTGAARGIGRAIAAELVSQGYLVLVTDLDASAAEATASEIGAHAGMALDVTDPSANRRVAVRAREVAPLGAWVCNAGVAFDGDLTDLTEHQVRLTVEVNVLGVMWGVRAAADAFREQVAVGVTGGEIGIVASLSAHAPVPNLSVYAATKAAVLSLATSIASELRHDRIGVHAVCPDGVSTAMLEGFDPEGSTREILAAGVLLSPETVARELIAMFGTRRVYRTMPVWRGVVARSASLSPALAMRLDPVMRRWGARRLRRAGVR
ncbi:SDR family NAD(P)-dependent oxidoreductase [Aeromicrobium endophyticum]|uniref:SDR family NAD(P)-dependent oxidoreductase n=1 Tax=Aeromicrobium endophyticum TaxID=2292704 RepID=A0A371P1M8_9ACTN|nr:SDR family oxidoreductase [Aeromicrobium endophyticum]REK69862.1 SDR family NAD(P)-dependent oxidoreductase [Aeromicrobium endophyticum]